MPEEQRGNEPSADRASSRGADEDGGADGGRGFKRPAVATVVAAAAAGTTAFAANRVLKGRAGKGDTGEGGSGSSSEGTGAREGESSRVSRAARKASKKGDPLVQALIETGWDAVKTTVAPAAERAAGAAGRFAATDAPEFVRETLLPPFIKAYEETRAQGGS
jgi:hypothetical protein